MWSVDALKKLSNFLIHCVFTEQYIHMLTPVKLGDIFININSNQWQFQHGLWLCFCPVHVLPTLQSSCPPVGDSFGSPTGRLFWEPMKTSDIKWNFEKFLVGPNGKPVMRWHPSVNISEVRADIHKYLLQLYAQDIFS